MNKDRGTIKWTALMLPEHITRLHEWRTESEKQAEQPLDEWTATKIERLLLYSYKQQQPITLTFSNNYQHSELQGIVVNIRYPEQRIRFNNTWVDIASIKNAEADDVYD